MTPSTANQNQARRPRRLAPWIGLGSLVVIVALAASVAIGTASRSWARPAPESFADLAEKVAPAVVNISTEWRAGVRMDVGEPGQEQPFPPGSPFEEFFKRFFGEDWPGFKGMPHGPAPGSGRVHALGTGFIISPDGYVVTNNHVVAQAEKIEVKLSNDGTYAAKLIGRDEKTDLALLKIDAKGSLPYVQFGNSDAVRVGDWVMAVGNPFGLGGTVTVGVISARGRDIEGGSLVDFLQLDAPINRGNSGGPSFNLNGEVIGVNSAIYSPNGGNIGIGFAIPSNLAKDVIAQLREHGSIERGWLGVQVQPVTPEIADGFGLDKPRGALVSSVTPDSPAAKAGIEPGDIIVGWNGKEISHLKELPRAVAATPVNKTVDVTVWRDKAERTLQVTTAVMPTEEPVAAAQQVAPGVAEIPGTGLFLADLTPKLRDRYDLGGEAAGVVIVHVAQDSMAATQGLQEGDVIVTVALQAVHDTQDVAKQIADSRKRGDSVAMLLVSRHGEQHFIALPIATS